MSNKKKMNELSNKDLEAVAGGGITDEALEIFGDASASGIFDEVEEVADDASSTISDAASSIFSDAPSDSSASTEPSLQGDEEEDIFFFEM